MLSPRYLAGLSDEITEIYSQLEADILADMARRIAKLGKVTAATEWQAHVLAEAGALRSDVRRIIKKYDPHIQKEITAIYNDAMIKNARADNRIFIEALGHGVSDTSAQVMLAAIQKTYSDLSRLTQTTALNSEQAFIRSANAQYQKVVTGAFDYDTALKQSVDELARRGVTIVRYDNGRPVELQIENAVRMNILTGVNHTAATMSINAAEAAGCDLVEVTAHVGARPTHEAWQGRVYSVSGTNPNYPPFSVCELGEIDGLCGINCKHSFYPYFEGYGQHYTADDLAEMTEPRYEYNGKTYTRYEAEQQQRHIEREIRRYKRQAVTEEAAGVDNTRARTKLGEWQAKARDFTDVTGIQRDYVREYIGTTDGKQPAGIKPKVIDTKQSGTKALDKQGLSDSGKSKARESLELYGVEKRTVYLYDKQPTEAEIIAKIGGPDQTTGSCSSLAQAYTANKAGYDVTDFRGGKSREVFSLRSTVDQIAKLDGVTSYIEYSNNDITAVHKLLKKVEPNKEYQLITGEHAAIIRYTNKDGMQYLELQGKANGYNKLDDFMLKHRFSCKKSHSVGGYKYQLANYLIDIETLANNREFIELLEYINTAEDMQRKGAGGYAK